MLLRTARIQTSAKKGNLIVKHLKNKSIDQIKYLLHSSPKKVAIILKKFFLNWEKEFGISGCLYGYINTLRPIKRLQVMSRGRRGIKTKPFVKFYFKCNI